MAVNRSGAVGGKSARTKAQRDAYADVPVLPVMQGEAYTPEGLAPVLTSWARAMGLPTVVMGIDVRSIVRGTRKRVASPVPRLTVRPADGSNRVHRYTLTEAADVLAAFGRMWGRSEDRLPEPFAGHHSGARTGGTVKRKPATRKPVARVKADPAPAPTVADATPSA